MITIRVNGEPRATADGTMLLALIQSLGINPELVAAQHNDQIVERANLAAVRLNEGDTIELIRIVGSG